MMRGVKITDAERAVLRKLGKRARLETEKRIGKKKLIQIARDQAHHGKEGGRPKVYDSPCRYQPKGSKTIKTYPRHRFVNGVCRCGAEKLTGE
jgi:hypothetical protein